MSMCRFASVTVAVLTVSVGAAKNQAFADCDPYSTHKVLPIPKALRLASTCGNGRVDEYATSCQATTFGGCDMTSKTTSSCTKQREVCDGKALAGQTCATSGYAKGTLRCASSCGDFIYDRCTVCLPGSTCREQSVRPVDYEDLTLIAQGSTVRAYWTDGKQLRMADVDKHGALVRQKAIAKIESLRLVPVQIGASAMAVSGPNEHPVLAIVNVTGTLSKVALPGQAGMLFLPILRVEGSALGLVVIGNQYESPKVLLVDESGATKPMTSLYASNAHRRIAAVPLSAGTHRVRWGTFDDTLTAEAGDFLMVMYDGHPWLSVVRSGIALNPFPKGPAAAAGTTPGVESPDVSLDGKTIMSFGILEDVALGAKHAPPQQSNAGLTHMFGDIAYDANHVAVARTSTIEVQASRVRPPGDPARYDYDKGPRHTLVIAVRSLIP